MVDGFSLYAGSVCESFQRSQLNQALSEEFGFEQQFPYYGSHS